MSDPRLTQFRLLVDPPRDGAWNMAVDEYLLGWTSDTGQCGWRFYQWTEATLSLGYFQDHREREAHAPSRPCPLVRRASGGGAILHDAELTYSLTVPLEHPLGRRRQWTYETIHRTLVAALSVWGIHAELYGDSGAVEERSTEFLCFSRRSSGDIVTGDVKIAGSAQRRAANAVLQHGSILLRRSEAAPELPGLLETTGAAIGIPDLIDAWQPRLAEVLQVGWRREGLRGDEEEQVSRIVDRKYGNLAWTEKARRRDRKGA